MTTPVVPTDIAFLAVLVATTLSFVTEFLGGLNAGMSFYRPMVDTVLDLWFAHDRGQRAASVDVINVSAVSVVMKTTFSSSTTPLLT